MQPRLRKCAGLGLALGTSLAASDAFADTAANLHVALDYRTDVAVHDCPTPDELTLNVAKQLGYSPFAEDAEQRLRIELTRVGEHIEAKIQWIDAQGRSQGERQLRSESSDCAEMAQSLSFAVAVQIQLHASEALAQATPEGSGGSKLQTQPAEKPAARPTPAPRAERKPPPAQRGPRRRVMLGAGGLATQGLTPGLSFGGRVFGALAADWWLVELGVHATLPSELTQSDGTGFSAQVLGVTLAPCLRLQPVGLCAAGMLGILHVRGEGVDRVGAPSSGLGGAGLRFQLLWPELTRLGLLVQGEALAVLTPRDVYLNGARVWSAAPIVFTASVDVAAIFR